MTVDWAVATVRQALRRNGRLANTLPVLTADNGWLMGDHRLEGKTYPYATGVPLYMQLAGGHTRPCAVDSESRSPTSTSRSTFCDVAGCSMPAADGQSLLPLITGDRRRLDRRYRLRRDAPPQPLLSPACARPSGLGRCRDHTRVHGRAVGLHPLPAPARRSSTTSLGPTSVEEPRRHGQPRPPCCGDLRGFWREVWERRRCHLAGQGPGPQCSGLACGAWLAFATGVGSAGWMGSEGACSRCARKMNGRASALIHAETRYEAA